ncbi:Uncharacterised protein [Mycobacteroides abscessus subsp. massiliense]|nr:Uncharacterised protein [Mycobacteroides abscessus subsp. massiliense]SKW12467.1 Uncharacterised protein [Mycobacteroides abscessus subsp. massiliense]
MRELLRGLLDDLRHTLELLNRVLNFVIGGVGLDQVVAQGRLSDAEVVRYGGAEVVGVGLTGGLGVITHRGVIQTHAALEQLGGGRGGHAFGNGVGEPTSDEDAYGGQAQQGRADWPASGAESGDRGRAAYPVGESA